VINDFADFGLKNISCFLAVSSRNVIFEGLLLQINWLIVGSFKVQYQITHELLIEKSQYQDQILSYFKNSINYGAVNVPS